VSFISADLIRVQLADTKYRRDASEVRNNANHQISAQLGLDPEDGDKPPGAKQFTLRYLPRECYVGVPLEKWTSIEAERHERTSKE